MVVSSEDIKAGASDKKLVVTGVYWNIIQLVINQGFLFIIRLILAKLLFPKEFGLVGMATVLTGFVQVFSDLGIGAALVQRKESKLTEAHYYTVFWTGVLWSVFVYLLLWIAVAPLATQFYNEPLLKNIIPVLGLGILASPINIVHRAQLTKAMNFKKITFISNASTIFSGLMSLALAFMGAGVWSLVFNSIAQIVIAMPLYFKATGWRPKFIWEKQAFKDIFGFGVFTTGTNISNYLFNNIDYFFIGKMLSSSFLGAYTLAFVLTDTFRSRLMSVMNNVMYPFYGKKQDDLPALKKYYLKVIQYNSIVIYPIMTFFVVLASPFIVSVFGSKWSETVLPLKILAGSVMVHMMVNSNTALIRGLGRAGLEMKLQLVKAIIFVPILFIGIKYNGIVGAAWAVLINKVIAVIIAQFTFRYLINIKISTVEFLQSIKVPAIAALVSATAGFALYNGNVHFIISGIAMTVVYAGIVSLMMGKELYDQIQQFRKKDKPREQKVKNY